jgi:hypothetical protein
MMVPIHAILHFESIAAIHYGIEIEMIGRVEPLNWINLKKKRKDL